MRRKHQLSVQLPGAEGIRDRVPQTYAAVEYPWQGYRDAGRALLTCPATSVPPAAMAVTSGDGWGAP